MEYKFTPIDKDDINEEENTTISINKPQGSNITPEEQKTIDDTMDSATKNGVDVTITAKESIIRISKQRLSEMIKREWAKKVKTIKKRDLFK